MLVLHVQCLPILDFPNRLGAFISLFSVEEPETQVGHAVSLWWGGGPSLAWSVFRTLQFPQRC